MKTVIRVESGTESTDHVPLYGEPTEAIVTWLPTPKLCAVVVLMVAMLSSRLVVATEYEVIGVTS